MKEIVGENKIISLSARLSVNAAIYVWSLLSHQRVKLTTRLNDHIKVRKTSQTSKFNPNYFANS